MTEHEQVAQAIIDRWGVRDRRGKINRWWSEFFFESGWGRVENKLSVEEWREFFFSVTRLVWRSLTSSALSASW